MVRTNNKWLHFSKEINTNEYYSQSSDDSKTTDWEKQSYKGSQAT